MAMRRHHNPALLGLLALMLVFPPLTGAVASGFGLDLSHHHCESETHGSVMSHHDDEHMSGDAAHVPSHYLDHHVDHHVDHHGAPQSDPYQCDQCHVVFAALTTDLPLSVIVPSPLPSPETATMLLAVQPPPAFRPPIG